MARRTLGNKRKGPTSDTRERLLTAAEELFARHGIAGTTVRAMAHRAGANIAAIGYHFGSKEDLAHEVFMAPSRRLNNLLANRLGALAKRREVGPPKLTEILETLAEELRRFAVERPGYAKLLATAAWQLPPSGMRDLRRAFAASRSILLTLLRGAYSGAADRDLVWKLCMIRASLLHWIGCDSCPFSNAHPNLSDPSFSRKVATLLSGHGPWRHQ